MSKGSRSTDDLPVHDMAEVRSSAIFSLRVLLLIIVAVLVLIDLALIFLWVPTEQSMGILFLIFYLHVPLAWTGFLAFGIVFVSSILYIWKRERKWDALGQAAAELGVLFTTLVLVTGSAWAKPANGFWWTWDPRLTTTLILWLTYVGYLMVRAYASTPSQASRYSAIVGIIAFINVPIVYLSAVWWRNIIHPVLYVGPVSEGSMDQRMVNVLMFSLLTFTGLLVYLLCERYTLRNNEDLIKDISYFERIS